MQRINRDLYLKKLIDAKDSAFIKVITGIRRCGKSYLLFNIYYDYLISLGIKKENIIKIKLDVEENEYLRDRHVLGKYVRDLIKSKNEQYYVFLDEIQFVSGFESVANSLNDIENVDLYLTGSNSKFLSSDILTEFKGRTHEIRVFPLSFSEFYSYKGGSKDEALEEYLVFGGLPLILEEKTIEGKSNYLKDVFNKTYLTDVIERNNIPKENILNSLVNILSSSIGSLTNPTNITNALKTMDKQDISNKTISNYIDYLIDAFIISKAERYDIKGKQYISSPYKYYFTDVGLRNARLNFREYEPQCLMENVIYNELISRGYNVDVGLIERYDKNKENKTIRIVNEVDFVCNLGSKKYYIQSVYKMSDENKVRQEKMSLLNVNDSFKKIIIVNDNTIPFYDENGIKTINLKDFLLNINSLED